jgi:nucleoside-diphosphate-sugar epimerase
MIIALTGGSGGIGRAVTTLALAEGHTIVSIDRVTPPEGTAQPDVRYIQADMTDYAAVEQAFAGCEAVIHLGAIPSPGRHPDHVVHNNNVVGSYNALRAAAELGITRVCQASSVNAIGHSYSRAPRYDYFPIDELHPTYNEDPYSLSKWVCEQQADSIARRYEQMQIASLRFHWVVPSIELPRSVQRQGASAPQPKHLWAWTHMAAAARACLLGVTATYSGHEVFFIIAPNIVPEDITSLELAARHYPDVPVRGDMSGNRSFFDSSKAERILGWRHDELE